MRVSLFVPCFVDQLTPQVAWAVVEVLRDLGHEVEFRDAQTCCGQPSFNAGHWGIARDAARRAIDVFRGAPAVVAPSGSCVAMVRRHVPDLLRGTPQHADALDLAARTFEFGEFLVRRLGVADVGARFPHRVAYHDGCHALRELGLRDEPRALLRSVRGLTLAELDDRQSCCGFGGVFSVAHPAISTAMAEEKARALCRAGVEFVVSSDPSCLLQIGGLLTRSRATVRTAHIAEVLASR